ncbi:NUDIX hydrolase, partial [Streptomyces sp. SID11233]|nr:NUDIX hydrolase [Streptomyces sp. SID11233]
QPCGTYEIVRIPFTRVGIASVHLVPLSLRHYLDGNIEGVLALLDADLG